MSPWSQCDQLAKATSWTETCMTRRSQPQEDPTCISERRNHESQVPEARMNLTMSFNRAFAVTWCEQKPDCDRQWKRIDLEGNRWPMGGLLIEEGGLKKGYSGLLEQRVDRASHSSLGSLPFPCHFMISLLCQYSQPESHILGTNIHINDCRVFVGFGDKNNQILPHQDSTDSIKLVCTGRCCHPSSKHRDICFGSLFFCSLWFRVTFGFYG